MKHRTAIEQCMGLDFVEVDEGLVVDARRQLRALLQLLKGVVWLRDNSGVDGFGILRIPLPRADLERCRKAGLLPPVKP